MAFTGSLRNGTLPHDAFTASLNALPALNFTVFASAMLISAPVAGLRPVRVEARNFC